MSDDSDRILRSAVARDERAFAVVAEPLRSELRAHCYRMLGSVHEAEDIVQEVFLRAWRGIEGFEPRSTFRAWLYKIATNACLDILRTRPARTLPASVYPATDPEEPIGERSDAALWVEPFPDMGLPDTPEDPEVHYARRECISLAFVAALQQLPPRQRATLILHDVVDLAASEVAKALSMTIPAVNSALHRARTTMARHKSVNHTLPPTDRRVQSLVNEFVEAMESGDLNRLIATLKADALWIMPPLPTWYKGRDAIGRFIATRVFAARARGTSRRRSLTRANGQPALAIYHQAAGRPVCDAFALQVLTIDESASQIAEVTTFLNPGLFRWFGLAREIPIPPG